jgi:chemotaxis protein MotA
VDFTSIAGLILGMGSVLLGQVLEGGKIEALIQPTAFLIVLGGTIGAVLLTFPQKDVINAVKSLPIVLINPKEKPGDIIELLINLALKARKEGILALQNEIKAISDPFLSKGLQLMTDGTDPGLLRELLETELRFYEEDCTQAGKVWEGAGGYTPTVGILGAVLGLIHVMENLSDPSKLGGGIAVAFVATVYGVGAANLIFLPLGSKIKLKKKDSVHIREMMIEGILAIQAGESPNFIREKLSVFDHSGGKHGEHKEGE